MKKAQRLWAGALLVLAVAPASCVRGPGDQDGTPGGSPYARQPTSPFRAVVEHVDDGDTFSVTAEGRAYRVRLSGVDAPEFDQRFGAEARSRLRTLMLGRPVEIRPTGIDQYGRLLACPIVDAENVCEVMVGEGWAWFYRQYSNDVRLAALENQARELRRGLWSDPDATPPWERRAEERQRSGAGTRASAAGNAAAPAASGPYRGNLRSLIYHGAGCPEYNCPNCTAVFATREAAEAAGYRPHRECAGK